MTPRIAIKSVQKRKPLLSCMHKAQYHACSPATTNSPTAHPPLAFLDIIFLGLLYKSASSPDIAIHCMLLTEECSS